MQERRQLWNAMQAHRGLTLDEEAGRLGIGTDTFDTCLSRGFAPKHSGGLRKLCERAGVPYNPHIWLEKKNLGATKIAADPIEWIEGPVVTTVDFYRSLEDLYGVTRNYNCLRVGGIFSSNRTRFKFDASNLATEPEEPSIRMPYLRVFWDRVTQDVLAGSSVHVVRTVDRLVELWAGMELLGQKNKQSSNSVYLAPVLPQDKRLERPAMGIRVLDERKTLFSIPAPEFGHSRYSSWVNSERLAAFSVNYIERLKEGGSILSSQTPVGLRKIIETNFDMLRFSPHSNSGNYGILDTFEKVEEMKRRMMRWVGNDVWLPVLG